MDSGSVAQSSNRSSPHKGGGSLRSGKIPKQGNTGVIFVAQWIEVTLQIEIRNNMCLLFLYVFVDGEIMSGLELNSAGKRV